MCNKDPCTTSHILSAYKAALSQRRFTFQHGHGFKAIKATHKNKIVKKGTRAKNKNSSPNGILHQASGQVLLGDLNDTSSFPPHIAFTELRPGITIFSNKLNKAILTELTCPWGENMEAWHNTKVKYMPLKSVIENNGWSVHLFPVEVGDGEY